MNLSLFLNQKSPPEGPLCPQRNKALEICPCQPGNISLGELQAGLPPGCLLRGTLLTGHERVVHTHCAFGSKVYSLLLQPFGKISIAIFFCCFWLFFFSPLKRGIDWSYVPQHTWSQLLRTFEFQASACECHQNRQGELFPSHPILKWLNFFSLFLLSSVSHGWPRGDGQERGFWMDES